MKRCFIEKWARIASTDILLTNVYSRPTFTTISNLPIKDYQLLMKRVEEMVTMGRELTYQSNIITDNTPGT
jgi:protein gp37